MGCNQIKTKLIPTFFPLQADLHPSDINAIDHCGIGRGGFGLLCD
jgi:hypothetical protein